MRQQNTWISLFVIATFSYLFMAGCSGCNEQHPGYEFMPDMSHTKAYKTYSSHPDFKDSMTALQPPEGTVPRNFQPYPYPNTKEGYEKAGKELTENPLPASEEVLTEGERLYNIYCKVCHGETGMGDGPITITAGGPFPPPPAYNSSQLKDLPVGKIYHSITRGKLNTQMPSYAPQLDAKERWMVTHYVQELQGEGAEDDTTTVEATADTTAAANEDQSSENADTTASK